MLRTEIVFYWTDYIPVFDKACSISSEWKHAGFGRLIITVFSKYFKDVFNRKNSRAGPRRTYTSSDNDYIELNQTSWVLWITWTAHKCITVLFNFNAASFCFSFYISLLIAFL